MGAGGFSYEDAAAICHCAVGTVKSRVARARKSLLSILEGDEPLPAAQQAPVNDAADEILAQLDRLAPGASQNNSIRRRKDVSHS